MSAILKQKLIDIANGFTKYGLWKGGGSGGSSSLADMTDVSFSNLKENDLLKYNGSVWINSANLHEYSTEEKIVGKWINGKPLYEKTVYFGSGTISNRASVSFENMNIDKIMVISGTFEDTIDGELSIPVSLDGTLYVGFYCNRVGILLTFSSAFNGRISNAYAIIQYTKTTD